MADSEILSGWSRERRRRDHERCLHALLVGNRVVPPPSVLAERLDYPEHQLRRLINGHMGYRNFSAFLNSYRIEDAKRQLADPGFARTPVLTIALDLGYGSLGPFNRAFKAQTGMTPTEYRRRHYAA